MSTRHQNSFSGTRRTAFGWSVAVLLVCLLAAITAAEVPAGGARTSAGSSAAAQDGDAPRKLVIEVSGRALTGPFSLPQQRGAHLFVPLVSIASALGDTVAFNAGSGTVELRRQTGEVAELNFGLRHVRENGSVVLSFSARYALEVPPRLEELMLPVELASAMLGASIHVDSAGVVRVTRGGAAAAAVESKARRGNFEIFNLDYEYTLNSYGSYRSHGLALRSTGRLGGGRYSLVTNSGTGGGVGAFGPLRGGTFTFESAGGRRLVLGDLGTGTDLQFLSTSLRGGLAQMNVGGARVTAFAGRVASGSQPFTFFLDADAQAAKEAERAKGLGYDTTVFGAYATFGASGRPAAAGGSWLFSAGAMHFGGRRGGDLLSAGTSYTSRRSRLQGDVAFGRFKGSGRRSRARPSPPTSPAPTT